METSFNPFKTVKGLVDYIKDEELGTRTLPSEGYPPGKL